MRVYSAVEVLSYVYRKSFSNRRLFACNARGLASQKFDVLCTPAFMAGVAITGTLGFMMGIVTVMQVPFHVLLTLFVSMF